MTISGTLSLIRPLREFRGMGNFGDMNFGDIYEQAVVKTVAGFFRGNSTHLFGIIRFGAPGVYVRTGSSHLNEVMWPQIIIGRIAPQQ